MPRRKRFGRFQAVALAFVLAIFWMGTSWRCGDSSHGGHHGTGEGEGEAEGTKVPLEIHIM